MKTVVLSLVALTCSCTNAFTVSTASLRTQTRSRISASSTSLRMGWSLKEADFIPSEEWLGEYMGEQGLRYRMDKTPKEVEEEGDYTLIEKLFGQTSNNKERMKLKKEVLAKANIPTNPSLYKTWTEKYGYGRFFPVYVDKSGMSEDSDEPVAKVAKAVAAPASAAKNSMFSAFSSAKSSAKATAAPAKKAVAKAVKAAPKPPVAEAKKSMFGAFASAKAKAAPAVKAAKAAPKVVAKKAAPIKKEVAKKAAPIKKEVAKQAASVKKEVKKVQGNINNIPKAL